MAAVAATQAAPVGDGYACNMSANADLSRIFNELAAMNELLGANAFRCGAYQRVADVLADLAMDVSTLGGDLKKLTAIDGIGESSAKKIVEFLKSGAVKEHQELQERVPAGLLEVMKVPGLGAKTVRLLWEKGGVVDLPSLQRAIESGALLNIPRMGEKSIEKIKASLEFMKAAGDRLRLGKALPLVESLVEQLREAVGDVADRIEFAGSVRRGRETIGDLDILASASRTGDYTHNVQKIAKAFASLPGVEEVIVSGATKVSVRLAAGGGRRVQADLRLIPAESFGAAWLYFTGSVEMNVAMRERAIKRGARLNEYGLFPDDGQDRPHERGIEPIAADPESAIFEALELPWIPPELREGNVLITEPPMALIEVGDIRAELHSHTTASDGRLSIEELAEEAKRRGYHTIAVTDHSRSSVQANGLSRERLLEHIEAIHEVRKKVKGITILAGSEVDILVDGRLDYEDDLLEKLDLVVASPHASLRQEPEVATKRLLAAIENPHVDILGHPTGRLIGEREGLHPDMPALVAAALKHGVAMEVNANSLRLDLRDAHVRLVTNAGGLIAIDTDAHSARDFDQLRFGVLTARRGWCLRDQCVNAWDAPRLRKWLARHD